MRSLCTDCVDCRSEFSNHDRSIQQILYISGGNQGKLHDEAENFFTQATVIEPEESGYSCWKTEETARIRIDVREVWTRGDIEWLPQKTDWVGLKSLACIRRTTREKRVVKQQTRYFISSLEANASHHGKIIRGQGHELG